MPKPSDIPLCPVAPQARASNQVISDYQISLITPYFGGGVEAGAPDETLPIRGISIRGQLQFWWRATLGAAFATGKDLLIVMPKFGERRKGAAQSKSRSATRM